MNLIEAIILGIIQGLSEFLPVSSSGHLEIAKVLLGTDVANSGQNLFFTITVHAATALSTILVFRKDIAAILWDVYTLKFTDNINLLLFIGLSMIPAGAVGFFFKSEIESLFDGNLILVGGMLLVTSLLLLTTVTLKPKRGILDFKKSLLIGIAQAVAILPGISRSGATISVGLMLGIRRDEVARFSFLMVLPVIFGAMLKELLDAPAAPVSGSIDPMALVVGFIAAFVTGFIACRWMIRLIRKSKLGYFAIYCAIVGCATLVYGFIK